MDFNKVILIGRLTREPEKSYTTTGTAVNKFGMAVNNGFGDNKKTVFVDITAWGKTAEFVSTYFKKGDPILVEGRLDFDSWTSKEGEKKSKLYVTAEKVNFAGGKKDNDNSATVAEDKKENNLAVNTEDIPF